MKWISVVGFDVDERVLCTWENYVAQDCPNLKLKKGDDFVVFYRNNKDRYVFEGEPYYSNPYAPDERLQHMINKNPQVNNMIERFDLVLTV